MSETDQLRERVQVLTARCSRYKQECEEALAEVDALKAQLAMTPTQRRNNRKRHKEPRDPARTLAIIKAHKQGELVREIAVRFGVSGHSIRVMCHHWKAWAEEQDHV